ncbi:hypothetical protein R1sor_001090 [Riccia sorocarpa]|uniref:RING-type E3 ubiquitin transferase n=1 Tax=Riccia sorocarpa TaxID=122646 RepID=A0ABD3GVA6_9MARC
MGQALRISCGSTAGQQLFAGIREGDVDYVVQMLRNDPKLLNAGFFYDRLAPLHVAAQSGQLQVLKMLLEQGANVNIVNSSGQTPLMLACKAGRWACLEPLLDAGAKILAFDYTRGRTCLHYASRGGHTECVRRILAAAAEGSVASTWGLPRFVNIRDARGISALHMASRQGHVPVVRLLLDCGALVSSTTTTTGNGPGHGSSPLHYAARGGSLESVRELLAWGADRSQRDLIGYTPYGIALKYSNTACAAILNPNAGEPLVWPSPWKFINDLEPEAKTLLEAALVQANDEREQEIAYRASRVEATRAKGQTKRRTLAAMLLSPERESGEVSVPATVTVAAPAQEEKQEEVQEAKEPVVDPPIETGGMGVQEVCCICFEQFCTIEVKECGHQMCATCTLNLCCHTKPNPAIPYSPPPACPFCRRNIGHLILARPKPKLQESKEKSRSKRSKRLGGSKRHSRGGSGGKAGSGGKGSFSGPLSSRIASCGSFGRGSSGRIADIDWLTRV